MIVALPEELRDELLAYLNARPRGEVNQLCLTLESLPEIEIEDVEQGGQIEQAAPHITLNTEAGRA